MRIEALKYRTEDNMDIIIVVDVLDQQSTEQPILFRIGDIRYKNSRKRNYESLMGKIRDDYGYRKLDRSGREKYVMQKFIEFVKEDILKQAIINAYDICKPDVTKIDVNAY